MLKLATLLIFPKKMPDHGVLPYKYGVYCILHKYIYIYGYIYIWYPGVLTTRVFSKQKPDQSILIGALSSGSSVSSAPCVKCQWVVFSQKVFTGNHGFYQLYDIILLFMYIYRLYYIYKCIEIHYIIYEEIKYKYYIIHVI